MPMGWRLGVFGSGAHCPTLPGGCLAPGSDLDLLVVHPVGEERAAAGVRQLLARECSKSGLLADVVVLSTREVESTAFWAAEGVVELSAAAKRCYG